MKMIQGKLQSAYSHFKNKNYENESTLDDEDSLLKWAKDVVECHPKYTMYHNVMRHNIDYIFYTP